MAFQKKRVDGLLFDKDGTLFDFARTWNGWGAEVIAHMADQDSSAAHSLAQHMRYSLEQGVFLSDSPIIAGTNREAAECVAAALPDRDVNEIEQHLLQSGAEVRQAEAVPLIPLFHTLSQHGFSLGVMTNDSEHGAKCHLAAAGILNYFSFVAGFDSGFGAKPDPDPLLAFAHAVGHSPERVVMVGDSRHDLIAGRAAGMQTIAVLTGLASSEELEPFADAVLPDIGHIPAWLNVEHKKNYHE